MTSQSAFGSRPSSEPKGLSIRDAISGSQLADGL